MSVVGRNRLAEIVTVGDLKEPDPAPLPSIIKQVPDEIQLKIDLVGDNARRIAQYTDALKKAVVEADRKKISGTVDRLVRQSKNVINDANESIDRVKKTAMENAAGSDSESQFRLGRARQRYRILKIGLDGAVEVHNHAADVFSKALRDMQIHQLQNRGLEEDTAKQILDSESATERRLLLQARLPDEDIEEMVDEIESRHDAILKLEQSIMEVNQLFKDVQRLVAIQQESVDDIEGHIARAQGRVESAHVDLTAADKHAANSLKCKCVALFILLVVAAIITLSMTLST